MNHQVLELSRTKTDGKKLSIVDTYCRCLYQNYLFSGTQVTDEYKGHLTGNFQINISEHAFLSWVYE